MATRDIINSNTDDDISELLRASQLINIECLQEIYFFIYIPILTKTTYREKKNLKKKTEKEDIVGNKAKGRISKPVFQESKARQNFRKTNISYTLIRTSTCAYQEVRNVCFSEILACFAFLKHPF